MVSELIDHTLVRFPRFATADIAVQPLEKGGSDRKFYRMGMGGVSMILAKYGNQREENRHYVNIARYLEGLGVRVPQIHFHDETEGLIWMEDLGDRDLWSHREEPWAARRELYRSALDQVMKMHAMAVEGHASIDGVTLQPVFDAALYRWEQGYFLENCLGRYFGVSAAAIEECRARLEEIAPQLEAEPRCLVHRDFQSQNIVVKDETACLIDFQGMRPGLPHYDLASLLYDPYVSLTPAERLELIAYYQEHSGVDGPHFHELYDLCAMQRLMQALGAYGFLGLVKERAHFLAHIPAAMRSLREVVARIRGLENLTSTLASLSEPRPPRFSWTVAGDSVQASV
jgi:aminoglycoside/choline kinase family phosphotransferase